MHFFLSSRHACSGLASGVGMWRSASQLSSRTVCTATLCYQMCAQVRVAFFRRAMVWLAHIVTTPRHCAVRHCPMLCMQAGLPVGVWQSLVSYRVVMHTRQACRAPALRRSFPCEQYLHAITECWRGLVACMAVSAHRMLWSISATRCQLIALVRTWHWCGRRLAVAAS